MDFTRKGKETRYVTAANIPVPEKDLMISVVWDETERKKDEDKIKALLNEKNILIKEVHHRIKNHIFTIKILLKLQMDNLSDEKARHAIKDTISRFESMEFLYNKLYQAEGNQDINFKSFLTELADTILDTFQGKTKLIIEKEIDDFSLDINKLLALGIITNEILTNTFKYAFPDKDQGTIKIICKNTEGNIRLIISDDGVGINNALISGNHGFGLNLIRMLVSQLEGTCDITSENGTVFTIKFQMINNFIQ